MTADASTPTGAPSGRAELDHEEETGPGGWFFWIAFALGWAVIAYGLWGAFDDEGATNPDELWRWIAGGLLLHDLILAPVVTLVGLGLGRFVPRPYRGPISAALVLSGLVVLFAYPLLRRYGERPLTPSALPQDYTRNVIVIVAAIWIVTAIWIVVDRVRRTDR